MMRSRWIVMSAALLALSLLALGPASAQDDRPQRGDDDRPRAEEPADRGLGMSVRVGPDGRITIVLERGEDRYERAFDPDELIDRLFEDDARRRGAPRAPGEGGPEGEGGAWDALPPELRAQVRELLRRAEEGDLPLPDLERFGIDPDDFRMDPDRPLDEQIERMREALERIPELRAMEDEMARAMEEMRALDERLRRRLRGDAPERARERERRRAAERERAREGERDRDRDRERDRDRRQDRERQEGAELF